jgi:hypothetical protein
MGPQHVSVFRAILKLIKEGNRKRNVFLHCCFALRNLTISYIFKKLGY